MKPLKIQFGKELRDKEGSMLLKIQLELGNGEWVGLFGPSGAGKTSLIRIIAGLDQPDQGSIHSGDILWTKVQKATSNKLDHQLSSKHEQPSKEKRPSKHEQPSKHKRSSKYERFSKHKRFSKLTLLLPTRDRNLGMVFQDQALFPHLKLKKQILFGQDPNSPDLEWVEELIQTLGLKGLENARMSTLSGGQRQRVALARALARKPDLLLLDEPFQGLDEESLELLLNLLGQIRIQGKTQAILITHRSEIMEQLVDRVYQMKRGEIIKMGPPKEIFRNGVVTLLQVEDQGETWKVRINKEGQPQTADLPKIVFPELKVGDQIRISGS